MGAQAISTQVSWIVIFSSTQSDLLSVTIGLEPKCTCPDYLKGNQCKHIVYALVTVLKAPPHLQYQLAFLSSVSWQRTSNHRRSALTGGCRNCEKSLLMHRLSQPKSTLRMIPLANENQWKGNAQFATWISMKNTTTLSGVARHVVTTYINLASINTRLVNVVQLSNVSTGTFLTPLFSRFLLPRTWLTRASRNPSRTPWQTDSSELSSIVQSGVIGEDGYVNVAHLTGQSPLRDVSTYHQPWVRRRYFGMGY